MTPPRCPRCFKRVDPDSVLAAIHICPMAPQEKRKRKPKAQPERKPA